MREIEKLINSGVSVEDIVAAAKEAAVKKKEAEAKTKERDIVREKLAQAVVAYVQTITPDLSSEEYSELKNGLIDMLKDYEQAYTKIADFKPSRAKSKSETVHRVMTLDEADEIIEKALRDLFG